MERKCIVTESRSEDNPLIHSLEHFHALCIFDSVLEAGKTKTNRTHQSCSHEHRRNCVPSPYSTGKEVG